MKKKNSSKVIGLILLNFIIFSFIFMPFSYCATEEIDPEFGKAPIIDGYIDVSAKEWNEAVKTQIFLDDLPINLWVMLTSQNLYFSIQLDLALAAHNPTEFVGIIISNSTTNNIEDFIDAKIIQFSNISEDSFNYFDYQINYSKFIIDTISNGEGSAKLEDYTSTYEFSIPIEEINENEEDSSLTFGESYSFNITYGVIPSYPDGIIKRSTIIINIPSLPPTKEFIMNLALFVLVIVVFSIIGVLFVLYIYKIFRLKKKIERIKR